MSIKSEINLYFILLYKLSRKDAIKPKIFIEHDKKISKKNMVIAGTMSTNSSNKTGRPREAF